MAPTRLGVLEGWSLQPCQRAGEDVLDEDSLLEFLNGASYTLVSANSKCLRIRYRMHFVLVFREPLNYVPEPFERTGTVNPMCPTTTNHINKDSVLIADWNA